MERSAKGIVYTSCVAEIHLICIQMSVFYINIKKLGYILERCGKGIVYISCVAEIYPIFIQMSVFYINI